MNAQQVAAAKAALDQHLAKRPAGKAPITVAFGLTLFSEFRRRGYFGTGDFANVAHFLGVPGAPRVLQLDAYGPELDVPVFADMATDHDKFVVGKSA